MQIAKMQEQIEDIRSRLTAETANYREAIKHDVKLSEIKPLYQKMKNTMKELRETMVTYEQLLTENMNEFDNRKR